MTIEICDRCRELYRAYRSVSDCRAAARHMLEETEWTKLEEHLQESGHLGLNERQIDYLVAIYDLDQEEESYIRSCGARGDRTPPAEQWRWLVCAPLDAGAPLHKTLLHRGLVDPGLGSTIKALADRGLIRRRYDLEPPALKARGLTILTDEPLLSVRLERAGRKLVRDLIGDARPPKKKFRWKDRPEPTLRVREWNALAQLQGALPMSVRSTGVHWLIWFDLERVNLVRTEDPPNNRNPENWIIHLTDEGRQYFEAHREFYEDQYRQYLTPGRA